MNTHSTPAGRLPGLRCLAHHSWAAAAAALVLALSGCASGGAGRLDWPREVRRLGLDPGAVTNPVAYTEEMAAAARVAAGEGADRDRLHRLQQHLFDAERFPFEYEATGTYGAEEAFRLRRGNCVSFTSLFVALGRAVGIPLQAALIHGGEAERDGNLVVVNDHMVAVHVESGGVAIYDFAQERDRPVSGLLLLDDLWLGAVHSNNRGTEELRAGRIPEAVEDLELATRLAPGFIAPYGNLGVARRMAGDVEGALDAYRRALEIDAGSPTILNNLAGLYRSLGRPEEAEAALKAADLSGATPFVLITRGDLERAQGRLRKALRLYRRAHRMAPDLPEPLLAIARAELERGRPRAARRALARIRGRSSGAQDLLDLLDARDPAPRTRREAAAVGAPGAQARRGGQDTGG